MIYIIKNKHITLSVNSDGGSMTSILYNGEERLWQGNKFWQSQDIVIFPIVGHTEEYCVEGKKYHPKSHGVARYSEFALADIGVDKLTLELTSNAVTKQYYPFDFSLRINYKLKGETIIITYTVKSEGGEIPFYLGGHAGMVAPEGRAEIEFENEENPVHYPVDSGMAERLSRLKKFTIDKAFLKQHKTYQLASLSGGNVCATTKDGFRYVYKSDCPVYAFWSNPDGGDYVCVEPWWGINDFDGCTQELSQKPFINTAGEKGKSFSYSLTIEKI